MNPMEDTSATEVLQPHVVELVERAQIDMQISTARKYPRDLARVKKRMLDFATLDEETAISCFYSVPRDGKQIFGPSVRLAEIAVSCYGNIRAAARIVDNDGKTITSQGVCHDLETNTLISMEVKRRITNKSGKTYSEDMQVTAGNAANSISFRNSVFKVIPGALWKAAYDEARRVAVGDATTLTAKRDKFIARLTAMGATKEMILARLEKTSVENIGLADLDILIGLGTAIKDGDISIEEAFAARGGSSEEATKVADEKKAALRQQGAKVTEIPRQETATKESAPAEAAKTEPQVATQSESGFKAGDDDLPPEMQGTVPQHITDLRNLEIKLKAAKRGGAFRDILEKHGFPRVEDVTEEKSMAVIADCEENLAARIAETPKNQKLKL